MRHFRCCAAVVAPLLPSVVGAQEPVAGAACAVAGYADAWTAHDVERIASTGKSIAVRGVSVMELEGGKIRRNTDYWDMATLLRQTGAIPSDSTGAPRHD